MTTQKQTKRFAELTVNNFEYEGSNYTVVNNSNVAKNDETEITQLFNDETLVTELKIKF